MKSRGFGDTVDKITTLTGIKRIAKKVADATGEDCGCEARRNALNKMLPYKK
jgi:hypothetical protein